MSAPNRRSGGFTVSHPSLEKLFAAYGVHPSGDGLVLFAFRGALPAGTAQGWSRSARLRLVPVDYAHMRCTLGIWDRRGRRIFAAPGSTVPHRDNAAKAAARPGRNKGKGTNQLEPGFYTDLSKGEHLQGKRNGHQALRQTAYRFYRRSLKGAPYRESDPLFYGNPYDNLHCGWNRDGRAEGFSSAGCMVVAGLPHCPRREDRPDNLGPWKTFHDLIYAAAQRHFPILLLPAASAAAALSATAALSSSASSAAPATAAPAAGTAGSGGTRLVFGSEGDAVKKLQRRLAATGSYRGRISGKLDARTYRAWKRKD